MFNFAESFKAKLERLVNINAASKLTDEQFIVKEINRFKQSQRRKEMLDGERYFDGCHDILSRERTVIGKDGELETVKNLPNNRIVDNQYKKDGHSENPTICWVNLSPSSVTMMLM